MTRREVYYARAALWATPLLRDLLREADAVFADLPIDAEMRALSRDPRCPRPLPLQADASWQGIAARLYLDRTQAVEDEAQALQSTAIPVQFLPETGAPEGPLQGRRVLVTRPREQAARLQALLRLRGAQPYLLPAISIAAPADKKPLETAVREAASYEMAVFTSQNGVHAFLAAQRAAGQDLRQLAGVHMNAVGVATAQAMREHGLIAEALPKRQSAAGLALHLLSVAKPGERVLLVGPEPPDAALQEALREGGLQVTAVGAYRTVLGADQGQGALITLQVPPHAVLFYSPSAVRGTLAALPRTLLQECRVIAVGATTATACEAEGLSPSAIAAQPSDESVVEALCGLFKH